MMRMTREAWQQAQYRHRMADGRPAIVHMVDGATVLEVVEFTDVCTCYVISGLRVSREGCQAHVDEWSS